MKPKENMESNNQEQQINKENFNRLVQREALAFRNKKIREILNKKNATDSEKYMLKIWGEMFGDNL